jgi:two-component system, cell cycle sensor histidine kinase and response regulator CckA
LSDNSNHRFYKCTRDELLDECLRLAEKNTHLESVLCDYQFLAEQHQFTQFAIDHLAMGAFWMTKEGKFIYVNDAACRLLGYTREELLKLNVWDIDPSATVQSWPEIWDQLSETKQHRLETRHRKKDGTLIPVEVVINHVEFHGVEFQCSFTRDISEEKENRRSLERELRFNQNLIEVAPVMIVVFDSRGRIVRSNPRFEVVTGYTQEEVADEDFVATFFRENDREWVGPLFDKLIRARIGKTPVLPMLTKSGEIKEVAWHGKSLRYDAEQPHSLLAIGQDVTEQRQMESRLRHSEKMEAIGLLAGGIAHDFNNQLGGILGYAEIMREELGDESRLTPYLNSISLAVRRASDLTGQLLAFSRKGKLSRTPLNLNKIILEVVDILRHSIDKRIVIEHHLMSEMARMEGDPSQLQNAVLNLAINSRDAMPSGGRLTFETALVTLDETFVLQHPLNIPYGKYICLTVSDNGIGMDETVMGRMFEPFFTTKRETEGTGMGLAAVYGTVTQHGGAITVSSRVGRGTRIDIYLPFLGEARATKESEPPPKIDSTSEGRIRVLLAEDEEVLQQVATEILQRLGCTVTACSDGKEAVTYFSQHSSEVDLVILDMGMPVMNGRETFLAMKEHDVRVPVIVVSGYTVDVEAREILDAGAQAFIQKPYRTRELFRAIREALGRR